MLLVLAMQLDNEYNSDQCISVLYNNYDSMSDKNTLVGNGHNCNATCLKDKIVKKIKNNQGNQDLNRNQ